MFEVIVDGSVPGLTMAASQPVIRLQFVARSRYGRIGHLSLIHISEAHETGRNLVCRLLGWYTIYRLSGALAPVEILPRA